MRPSKPRFAPLRAQRPLLVLLAVVLAVLTAACGDGARPPITPSGAAPRNVIAFGARDADGGHGLYLIQPDGANFQKLSSETDAVSFPRWSPAGDRIAYIVGSSTLRVYDFQAGAATTLSDRALAGADGPAASWSPDGRRLAFVEASDGGRVRVYDVERGELDEDFAVSGTEAEWSPSGDELAIVSPAGPEQESDLYLVEADGGDLRPLLERTGREGGPRWSPDGRRLAFWSAPSGQPDQRGLFVLERESGRLTEPAPGADPAWSPDREQLAYSGPTTAADRNDTDIFLIAAEGGVSQPLNPSITLDRWPSWAASSDAVAYLALADPETGFICIVRLRPEDRNCLDLPDLLPSAPAWSPF